MAIGRITGSVLKSNLTRNGVDLAFETNLLYLDVTNNRVGIGTSEPTTALHVVGTTTITGALNISGALTVGSFSPDTISVNNISSADSTSIQINDGMNIAGTLTAKTFVTNELNSEDSTAIQVNDAMNISGALTANSGFVANSITYPTADGTAAQVMQTNGSGVLSFVTISTNSVSQGNSNITVTDAGTGSITIAADGATTVTFDAATAMDASAANNAIRLPNGTTGQRPGGSTGMIRYNSSSDTIEGFTSAGGWAQLGATSSTAENTNDTSTGTAAQISTTAKLVDQFSTSSFDSAIYYAVTRDEINDEVSTARYSLVHNDTDAFVATSHITQSNDSNQYITVTADVIGGNARLLATGTAVVNSVSFYRVALGDNTSAATTGNVTTFINTDVDSAAEKIDGWLMTYYRGAKYILSINNTTTGEVSTTEALVVHDGSAAYITQYGNVNSGGNDLITLTTEIDSTEVILKASAQAPNCRVTGYRILLEDGESASTGDNVNIIGATTVSSTATSIDSFNKEAFTGCHYVIVGHNSAEGAASIAEVMLVANDDAYLAAGPTLSSKGTDQLTFTASMSGNTVTLQAASTSGSSTTVNAYRVQLLRGTAGAATADTVLVSTTQTITGQKTFSQEVLLNSISSADSTAIQINDAVNVSGTLTAANITNNSLVTNNISSSESTAIQVDDAMNISGTLTANSTVTFNAGYVEKINALTSSSTITVNCALAPVHKVTLAINTAFVITNLPTGGSATVIVVQDATGSRTATFGTDTSTAVKFAGGTPTLSTAANSIDLVTIFNDGTNYYGDIGKAYA